MTETPFEIAERLVEEIIEQRPLEATLLGVPGHDHQWDDFSLEGQAAQADLARRFRDRLSGHMGHPDPVQRRAARVVHDWLGEALAGYEAGEHLLAVSHIFGPFQGIRSIFEIMDRSTPKGWENVCRRLQTVAGAFAAHRQCLEEGRRVGKTVAARQVRSVIEQAHHLAGPDSAWHDLERQLADTAWDHLSVRLADAIAGGRAAASAFADYLEQTYLPDAGSEDGVGEERYLLHSDQFLGLAIDPSEVYGWGWEEVARLMAEMKRVAAEIDAESTLDEVTQMLETDPSRAAPSPQAFLEFVQGIEDEALAQLDGSHFEVPEPIRRITVKLAPPGGALGAHYIQPTEDFSRPGGVWYTIGDKKVIPLWQEVSTAYHEGFPGHHLQVGTSLCQADRLSRAHRTLIWYSGYGEGWALYTERLMDELGFFGRPEYLLGMLASQLFRACRVVVDIGCHLGYRIPDKAPLLAGERWSFEHAVTYMNRIGRQTQAVAQSEVLRYLGWPAQAISYKVGEREILKLREEMARRRYFNLKEFHSRVLTGGEVRLDYLRESMLG